MFELKDVCYLDVLDLPGMTMEEKKITTLVGQSGSGKTTLLKLLNKMISPTSGQVLYQGTDLEELDTVEHRRRVAMLAQTPAMFDGTVADNLTAGLRYQNREIPSDDVLTAALEEVQLHKPLTGAVGTLSGGEKQRLALARVILLDPEVYLLDEPSSALDERTEEQIIEMLVRHVRDRDRTMVLVTHSSRIAETYADRIIEIESGRGRTRR